MPLYTLTEGVSRQDRLACGDEGTDRFLDGGPLGAEDLKHFVSLPELVWGDVKSVLVHDEVLGQA